MTRTDTQKSVGILVAGGPAPGINSVISAVTLYCMDRGVRVVGIRDGFKWIMRGDISHVHHFTLDEISRIHFRGGSHIGVSRDNPTTDPKYLEQAVTSLLRLNIDQLITVGGDDTAHSARMLEEHARGRLRVVHVPKTIDNDLDLPYGINTFGFQTARHYGVEIVKNLMEDALTTTRWYLVISMGRHTGHLAHGIGKATGATLTIIPEEFEGKNTLTLKKLVDILAGAIIKRLSYGRQHGVAVLAEGLVEAVTPEDVRDLEFVERDAHGNIRLAEINFGEVLKQKLQQRLAQFKIKTTLVAKNIGYELRCADPIPFDMEYSRDLGYCAAKFILEGGNRTMVSVQYGRFVPISFDQLVDPATGRPRIRKVDIRHEDYAIARAYMIRLTREDFADPHVLANFAATAGVGLADFEREFKYVVEHDFVPQMRYHPHTEVSPEKRGAEPKRKRGK